MDFLRNKLLPFFTLSRKVNPTCLVKKALSMLLRRESSSSVIKAEREKVVELLNGSSFFDKAWYLQEYSDVAQAGADPVLHYLDHGASEGRNPSKFFDTVFYGDNNPDVKQSGLNPLYHFIVWGQNEGRLPNRAVQGGEWVSRDIRSSLTTPRLLPTIFADAPWVYPIKTDSRPIIIFESHDLMLQGAPTSLFEIARGINRMGRFQPILSSPEHDGPFPTYSQFP